MHQYADYMPHGACWLWDRWLIAMHGIGDLGTWFYYMLIPLIVLYIYRHGRLSRLAAAYPKLWRRGAGFILFCGINHLGAFFEIWVGGRIYYLTGVNKILMLVASGLFAWEFWKHRHDLVMVGLVLQEVDRREGDRRRTTSGGRA